MGEDIISATSGNIHHVKEINRELTEKALHMRCLSYLSKIKEALLIETIYEIDSGKKHLMELNRELSNQKSKIENQQHELEKKNRELVALQESLEQTVRDRTYELMEANSRLLNEIREKNRLQQEKENFWKQLLQSQKMEIIGRLTDGIIHDFNNLLTTILGSSQYVLRVLTPEHPVYEDISTIMLAGDKCAALINHLLSFSRKKNVEKRALDLNSVFAGILQILERLIGKNIKVEFYLEEDLSKIYADVCQLEQILLNLSVNAKDAMPEGGRLIIETANLELDQTHMHYNKELTPGKYVLLSVTDTGKGIAPEIKENIFEPFFSTKEDHKGTGLGLSTVLGIVEECGAHIAVYSEVGRGTTFKIYFKSLELQEIKSSREQMTMPPGNESILIVENEDSVRQLVSETLSSLGYSVLEVSNGREAWEYYREGGQDIDLVLSDIIMPEINGFRLKELILEANPEARILFMSSYSEKIVEEASNGIFLQKPFTPSSLANVVRSFLDSSK